MQPMNQLNMSLVLLPPQEERIKTRAGAASKSVRAYLILLLVVIEALSSPRGLDGRVSPAKRKGLLVVLNNPFSKFSRQALHKVLCMLAKWGCIDLDGSEVRASEALLKEIQELGPAGAVVEAPAHDAAANSALIKGATHGSDASISAAAGTMADLDAARDLIVSELSLAAAKPKSDVLNDLMIAASGPVDTVLGAAAAVLCAIRSGVSVKDLAQEICQVRLGTSKIAALDVQAFASLEKERQQAKAAEFHAKPSSESLLAQGRARADHEVEGGWNARAELEKIRQSARDWMYGAEGPGTEAFRP